jgi:hypothetical protein
VFTELQYSSRWLMSALIIAQPDSIAITDPARDRAGLQHQVHLNYIERFGSVQFSSVPVTHFIWKSSSHCGIDKDSIIWGMTPCRLLLSDFWGGAFSLHIYGLCCFNGMNCIDTEDGGKTLLRNDRK